MTERIQQYFEELHQKLSKAYAVAQKARLKGFDPQDKVELRITKNMAERVVGLISVIAPQIANEKIVERILQLERTYGALDWRIALTIAEEVAEGRFCTFQSKKEAMEVGIRTGLAYVTLGVVSAPLDGFVGLELKQRTDGGGEYFCLNFAGPMRNAGGTAMAVSVLIADYVRRKMGYASYDATDEEVKRAITELQDYHERVTNLQYNPSPEELAFLIKNLPVEIGGEPSEKIEVSNYRDLPRIPTNYIRSGYCLVLSAGLSLKAPKLYKQISAWGKDFGLDGWNWLADFIKIQKSVKAKGEQKKGPLEPDYTYLNDLVAGRPVLGNPLAAGAFRLRYGRTRTSGYSAQAVHPATMEILNNFLAIGTQLKLERPSKSTAITICDTIEGPIVKLQDGSVLFLETQEMANAVKQKISEILFLGDILISYGDFNNRAQPLAPVGYCEEWWIKELEKAMVESFGSIDCSKLSELCEIPETFLERLLKAPLTTKPTALQAVSLSKKLTIPLHPRYTFHWKDISLEQLKSLLDALPDAKISKSNGIVEKIELPNKNGVKRTLELVGVPHRLDEGKIVVEKDWALALAVSFSLTEKDVKWLSSATSKVLIEPQTDTLAVVNKLSEVFLRDKSGTYIGARMGRPEKANMRQLVGSPNCLFPVGKEGGKLRAVQSALEVGKIVAEAMIWWCPLCNKSRLYRVCEVCGSRTEHRYYCEGCKQVVMQQNCPRHGPAKDYMQQVINIKEIFSALIKKLGMQVYPDIIKGVRGTSNEKHFVEHLAKGILRAKWSLTVNKDGTIRYDASELPITHFKPFEIGTPISKLRELGYEKDIHGKPLVSDQQILELLPQDVILPSCPVLGSEPADSMLLRTAQFIDELLLKLYGLPPFYNVKSAEELIGTLIVSIAPHTSAGVIGRVIGFSKTQCFLAHPYFHAANRRDCDGDELGFMLLMDALLNFSREFLPSTRGGTMDAPLVVTAEIVPTEVDDMVFDLDIGWELPLELYLAALETKSTSAVQMKQLRSVLGTDAQFEGHGFSHPTRDINGGVLCSAYKTLPTMEEKLKGQMALASKIRAVDAAEVARLVVEKHLLKDTKGNLRKFFNQEFRCVACNLKYRRVPLKGICSCGGRLIFTVSKGSIVKYLEPMLWLAKEYTLPRYLIQSIELLRTRIEELFGKEKEKQLEIFAFANKD